jgi:hypothetical protein
MNAPIAAAPASSAWYSWIWQLRKASVFGVYPMPRHVSAFAAIRSAMICSLAHPASSKSTMAYRMVPSSEVTG